MTVRGRRELFISFTVIDEVLLPLRQILSAAMKLCITLQPRTRGIKRENRGGKDGMKERMQEIKITREGWKEKICQMSKYKVSC